MGDYQYEINFLYSLLLTVVTESILLYLLLFIPYFNKIREKGIPRVIFAGVLATILTLPYLWFVLPIILHNKTAYHLWGELSVVFVESLIYYFILNTDFKKLLILSLLCNAGSYLLGLLIF